MELIVIHYHLNPGGVTRVIEGHVEALATLAPDQRPSRVHLLFDGQRAGWEPEGLGKCGIPVSTHVIPELAYQDRPTDESSALWNKISSYLETQRLDPGACLLHVHNPTLGKTASLAGALHRLADAGYAMLLHPHDFAEDLRPENYRLLADAWGGLPAVPPRLYFHGARVHWAVLNHRDLEILRRAGIPRERLHWLPNPIQGRRASRDDRRRSRRQAEQSLGFDRSRKFFLYPVRGIRRKNVGELLLLSAMLSHRAFFALTLPPKNPREVPVYEHWASTARRLELPVDLASGTHQGLSFDAQRAAADWIVTTSVAEGFGLAFLESWLVGRPLAGRDLPEITRPFSEAGIRFDALAPTLQVPVEWVRADRIIASLIDHYRELVTAFGERAPAEERLRQQASSLIVEDAIDVAYLDIAQQTEVIELVATSAARREELLRRNPLWHRIEAGWSIGEDTIQSNAAAVETDFGFPAIGGRLASIYAALQGAAVSDIEPLSQPEAVLNAFLQLARLHPIRLA